MSARLGFVALLLTLAAGASRVASAQPASLDPYGPSDRAEEERKADEDYEIRQPKLEDEPEAPRRVHEEPPAEKTTGWEFTQNPDRYPSILYTQTGGDTVNGHQDDQGPAASAVVRGFSATSQINLLLPVADAWTVNVAGGINLSETDRYANATTKENVDDNSVATYQVGIRHYLVGTQGPWGTRENPDRWPSFGLRVTGSETIPYDVVNTNGTTSQDFSSKSWEFDSENRFPLSDWYTIVPTLTEKYGYSDLSEIPHVLSSTIARSYVVGGTIEQRFYLVGRNLIAHDEGRNPDRWSSAYLDLDGLHTTASRQYFNFDGGASSRDQKSTVLGAALGTRLPMTSHATLQLEIDYTYTGNRTPSVGTAVGARTTTNVVGALTSFRYYFF